MINQETGQQPRNTIEVANVIDARSMGLSKDGIPDTLFKFISITSQHKKEERITHAWVNALDKSRHGKRAILSLAFCNLIEVPEEAGALLAAFNSLEELDLAGNANLSSVKNFHIESLTTLEVLNLSSCRNLTTLPELSGLTHLKELYLSGCYKLTTLPDLSSLTHLKKLYLSDSHKRLTTPSDLSGLINLQTLYLDVHAKAAYYHEEDR